MSRRHRVKTRRLRRRVSEVQHLLWELAESLLRARLNLVASNQSDTIVLGYIRQVDSLWTKFVEHLEPFRNNILAFPGKDFLLYQMFCELRAIKSVCVDYGYHIVSSR